MDEDELIKLFGSGNHLIKPFPKIRCHTVCEYTNTDPPIMVQRVEDMSKKNKEYKEKAKKALENHTDINCKCGAVGSKHSCPYLEELNCDYSTW